MANTNLSKMFLLIFGIKNNKQFTENIFSEIFNKYHDLGKKTQFYILLLLMSLVNFLEYASQNDPEKELYFIQQLAEFANNPDIQYSLIYYCSSKF